MHIQLSSVTQVKERNQTGNGGLSWHRKHVQEVRLHAKLPTDKEKKVRKPVKLPIVSLSRRGKLAGEECWQECASAARRGSFAFSRWLTKQPLLWEVSLAGAWVSARMAQKHNFVNACSGPIQAYRCLLCWL